MTLRLTLVLCATLALAACDSGTTADVDSGPGLDSGMMSMTDGGSPGTDAGGGSDAGGGVDSGPSDDAGSTDAGPTGTDGGAGACTNTADTAALASVDIATIAEDCGRSCFGGRMCVINCVVRDAGVSNPCAVCFGDVSQCTLRNCLADCSGSDMTACDTCRAMAGCTSAFEMCSGLSGT